MANRISLDGQVFQPETRYSQTTGKPMLNFNLSFYDGKTADGKTKYGSIRVRAFGPLAENIGKAFNKFADDGKPVTVQQSAEDPAAGAPIPDEEIPF